MFSVNHLPVVEKALHTRTHLDGTKQNSAAVFHHLTGEQRPCRVNDITLKLGQLTMTSQFFLRSFLGHCHVVASCSA